MSGVVGTLHERLVFSRRTQVLAKQIGETIPSGVKTVLDVGCGDGTIDALLMEHRPSLTIDGVDVLIRPTTRIPVRSFDGNHIPFDDKSKDVVLFVDVLHHTTDPMVLLREARRVARYAVVIKDHTMDGLLAYTTLRAMDWVGNAHHNVVLPYNYWPKSRWTDAFNVLNFKTYQWRDKLGLYPAPVSWVCERSLHFVGGLTVRE